MKGPAPFFEHLPASSYAIHEGALLAPYSTFGIGGKARYLIEASAIDALSAAMRFAQSEKLPLLVIGKGSNTLFSDAGFAGVVLINRYQPFEHLGRGLFRLGAGLSFPYVSAKTARLGYSGLEFAAGIPGSVGGAIFMNAGAHGSETKDALEGVTYLKREGSLESYSKDQLSFSYRYCSLQVQEGAIVDALFQLHPLLNAEKRNLQFLQERKKSQPYKDKSCGCIFRNPSGSSAGRLVDRCGLKGTRVGGAEVSPLHANFIVNAGGAKAEDVLELIALIQERVWQQEGVQLEHEVRYIPYEGLKSGLF